MIICCMQLYIFYVPILGKDTVEDISSLSTVSLMNIEALLEDLNKYDMAVDSAFTMN